MSKSIPSTPPQHLLAGQHCENLALHYLQTQGLRLLERNFRCRFGELDLIMQSDSCIIVVEVRYRRSARFGGAAVTVTRKKQLKVIKSTLLLLQHRPALNNLAVRFDVVAISGRLASPKISWLKAAFSADGII